MEKKKYSIKETKKIPLDAGFIELESYYYEKRKDYSSSESGTRIEKIFDAVGNEYKVSYWEKFTDVVIMDGITCSIIKESDYTKNASYLSTNTIIKVEKSANLPVLVLFKDFNDYVAHDNPDVFAHEKKFYFIKVE